MWQQTEVAQPAVGLAIPESAASSPAISPTCGRDTASGSRSSGSDCGRRSDLELRRQRNVERLRQSRCGTRSARWRLLAAALINGLLPAELMSRARALVVVQIAKLSP
jgi:hypothetical protein